MKSTNHTTEANADVKALLLEDYRNFADSFWKNEQTGETRVNWFIGIVTAAAGGLIGLTSADHRPHGEPLRLIFVASLVALLAFGIVTLFRILKRNETTDGYKHDSDTIRQIFKDHFDDNHILLQYHPFGKGGSTGMIVRRLGGLAHTVLTINSLLLGGIAAAFFFPLGVSATPGASLKASYLGGFGAFAGAFVLQFYLVRITDSNAKKRLRIAKPTHAGGIVYQLSDSGVKYLLVGPSKAVPDEWLFPKGHIERGEEDWEAALREVCEETGSVARLITEVGVEEFEVGHEKVVARYFLMALVSVVERDDKRRMDWFEFDEAIKLRLTHPGNKCLLIQAERKRLKVCKAKNQPQSSNAGVSASG